MELVLHRKHNQICGYHVSFAFNAERYSHVVEFSDFGDACELTDFYESLVLINCYGMVRNLIIGISIVKRTKFIKELFEFMFILHRNSVT
jgi:hypothetical protein